MSFADTFSFSRPSAASYVDARGVTMIAAANQPRFDYLNGRPAGLLVEAGSEMGQADRIRLLARDWSASATWTLLHDWRDGGVARADAHYATDPAAMINGCLAMVGHHRRIAAIAGYLVNYGGWIWALGQRWMLPGLLADSQGAALASDLAKPLLVA